MAYTWRREMRLALGVVLAVFMLAAHGWPQSELLREGLGVSLVDKLLFGRQSLPDGQCSKSQACSDKSCCNGNSGFCGLDPDHCGPDVCISNCDAKADCGIGAATPGQTCPLNVCCSPWGKCGVTEDFCGAGCQSNCNQPNATVLSDGDVQSLVIGYIESWVISPPTSGCAARNWAFMPIDSLTHINVAFGYIKPTADFYVITPIDGVDLSIFQEITNLKQQAPGLKIWLSLGGWTFSDPDQATQPVWSNVASSPANIETFVNVLVAFMKQWGFDGVDLDWEYPGDHDRGGSPADTANYVSLVRTIRQRFDTMVDETGGTFGLSFTAPTSYWYLRWFDIGAMVQYVDWVNLMTYDLHGDWDGPKDDIGAYVFAHTNLTEIEAALNLLWRNDVPADKVNLGLGFYGRSYTLLEAGCDSPGCPFSVAGEAGPCTNTNGYLSYDEIMTIKNKNNYDVMYDEIAGVKYFAYGENQWVSFDDEETLQQKVKFANSQGLRGLFIWAIDQDNVNHDALNAVLYPKGLGAFSKQNGIGTANYGTWGLQASSCYFSACSDNPICSQAGYIADGHAIRCDGGSHRQLCCPLAAAPDPTTCHWTYGNGPLTCFGARCPSDTVLIAESYWYWQEENGGTGDAACFGGPAKYCCSLSEDPRSVCGQNTGTCITINTGTGQPASPEDSANACPTGRKFVTFSKGTCDTSKGLYMPWCCADSVDPSACHWAESPPVNGRVNCDSANTCGRNEINLGTDSLGGGSDCSAYVPNYNFGQSDQSPGQAEDKPRSLCCVANALHVSTNNLPVPLDYIFPSDPPDTYNSDFEIHTDTGLNPNGILGDLNPNNNAFGWYIISGPPDEVSTMDKRDGSHWELLGCTPDMGEERHTVQAVCTDDSAESNCGDIFLGEVATTVVKMPEGCGPGKYAVAVSMDAVPPEQQQQQSPLPKKLVKRLSERGITVPRVYSFTFDYDFGPIVRRQDSDKLIRIDYSDDPGYWANIVLAKPGAPAKREEAAAYFQKRDMERRALEDEVARDHGGSWERFLDHRWSMERRATPHEDLHLLHKKWFSATLADWLYEQRHIDTTYELVRHHIDDVYTWNIFDYSKVCSWGEAQTTQYLKIWADLYVKVETAASLTLIGDFGHLESFAESHVLFRNSGSVKATLNFDAFAQMQFNSGRKEIFGLQNFGATFSVPGIVTIGPNLRVFAEIDGVASFHANAQVSVQLADWDFTQQYPNTGNDVESGLSADGNGSALGNIAASDDTTASGPQWQGDVSAQGSLTVHLTPVAQLGIVFNILSETIPDTVVELGLDTYGTVYASASASVSNTAGTAEACFGAKIGYELYAQVNAPSLFGYSLNRYWPLNTGDRELLGPGGACVDYTAYNNTSA